VRVCDVTGLAALSEVMMDVRRAGVLIALINMTPEVCLCPYPALCVSFPAWVRLDPSSHPHPIHVIQVKKQVDKFGIKSDTSSADVPFGEYIQTTPDGRLYVTSRRSEVTSSGGADLESGDGSQGNTRRAGVADDVDPTDASPLVGGDRKKPIPEPVGSKNASNFSVPSLYPPLSLDGAAMVPLTGSLDERDFIPPKGEKTV
jgi:hypothetical protein